MRVSDLARGFRREFIHAGKVRCGRGRKRSDQLPKITDKGYPDEHSGDVKQQVGHRCLHRLSRLVTGGEQGGDAGADIGAKNQSDAGGSFFSCVSRISLFQNYGEVIFLAFLNYLQAER
ncbi:MAG: hypothetical protein GY862_01925 [Gammaproteobacteria bacterium]|nr:hypothetical protein [Gammaproteobacteria bacterium]